MILTAKNIYKSYISGSIENSVLMGLDLQLNDGEIVAIRGASGSGKSTFLNILGLLDVPDSGEIEVDGMRIESIYDVSNERSQSIGFLFQFHHLLSEFTVLENLLIPLILDKNSSEANKLIWCEELLSALNLSHLERRYPSELSGGERQRIAFLRSLVNKPKFILADEPTGNLDTHNTKILLELIKKFRDKYNISFIIATHDENVTKICDRILKLKNGKLHIINRNN
jgi:ABC-type lipoprotein export system ATPase subunit